MILSFTKSETIPRKENEVFESSQAWWGKYTALAAERIQGTGLIFK